MQGGGGAFVKNVLIMDDNADILESIRKGLTGRLKDCRIMTAFDCENAERIWMAEHVDLLLADLQMPLASGYDFIEKARRAMPSIPVCVMTGGCPPGVVERLRALGVSHIIGKPFELDRLADILSEELDPHAGLFSPPSPAGG